jgi:hypothetical protein
MVFCLDGLDEPHQSAEASSGAAVRAPWTCPRQSRHTEAVLYGLQLKGPHPLLLLLLPLPLPPSPSRAVPAAGHANTRPV